VQRKALLAYCFACWPVVLGLGVAFGPGKGLLAYFLWLLASCTSVAIRKFLNHLRPSFTFLPRWNISS
jgi:hypothetical protein